MPSPPRSMTAGQWLLLLLLGLIWGASFFFIKVAVPATGPFSVVFWRCALGALALLLILRAMGQPLPAGRANWLRLSLLGLAGSLLPFALISWAETRIPGALAGMLNATTPLFAVVLLHFTAREERLTPARLGGVAAGLAGVALLLGPDALRGRGADLPAQLAVLGAALLYAVAAIYVKRLTHQPALTIALGQLTFTALACLPLMLLFDRPWLKSPPGLAVLASLAALGLLSTALAQSLYYRLINGAGAANATLVTFIIPASATLLGVLVLGERIGLRHVGGMTLIALGLALIDGRVLAWLPRRA
jgi:drug/metabolite transporter (DMT)-like permease